MPRWRGLILLLHILVCDLFICRGVGAILAYRLDSWCLWSWRHSFAVEFLELKRRVLFEELFNDEEATPNLDLKLLAFNLDQDASRAKSILSGRLTDEHDLELLAIKLTVEVLGEHKINGVRLHWDVELLG